MSEIPKEELVNGRYYKFMGIDLISGVWCSERQVFLGLREKWGRLDLSYDDYEATRKIKDSGYEIPEAIECREFMGTFDRVSGREIEYDAEIKNPDTGGNGGYLFKDDGSAAPPIKNSHGELQFLQELRGNTMLYKWLTAQER